MDVREYFKSLTNELHALKDRVRNLIDINHQLSDGEWKESVLRAIVRRHLPANIDVGRGFIVKTEAPSKQVDILFYDNSKPVLFRDGDLLFITPDATKGIVEVKTRINDIAGLRTVLRKLAGNLKFVLQSRGIEENDNFFCGLFAYETNLNDAHTTQILELVKEVSENNSLQIINHICLGKNIFVKYWSYSPETLLDNYNKWHLYKLENLSPGYFVNNIVDTFSKSSVGINQRVWFPVQGKEGNKLGEITFGNG
jgi:hypothetical protein